MTERSARLIAAYMVGLWTAFVAGAANLRPAEPPTPSQRPVTTAVYDTREFAGFTLKINREFIDKDPALLERVLVQLHADLNEIEHLVPQPAAVALRDVTVWIEFQGYNGMGHGGHGLCCHWSPSWLTANGLPAEKAGGVEIINPTDYLTWRRDQPYMLFHEFAHAYHWRLGAKDDEIGRAYRAAIDKHLYDAVERNSIPVGQTTKAYAATNDHEYFAELSEAYFAVNDFYPYTRAQLKAHDPEGAMLIERLWNLTAVQIAEARRDREPAPGRAAAGRPSAVALAAEPFPLSAVRLLPGSPFAASQELEHTYLLEEDPERLLHNFRVNAGLGSVAKPLGGWEEPACELRGHYTGHFLSALALMYQSTGDQRLKERAGYLVAQLALCQDKLGTGYLSAYPESYIDRLIKGERVWAPWYTLHKIAAGLLDVHTLCGNPQALSVATGFAAWCKAKTDPLGDEQVQKMLNTEFGGMPEFFANLYALTGNPDHIALARRFTHKRVLDPLSAGEDRLKGLHVNTQIPKAIAAARIYELTGDEYYGKAARFFWETVTQGRCYATGGASNYEYFRNDPGTLDGSQSSNDHENCVTYNLLRLSRDLFCQDPQERYAAYYERALLNGILGTHHPSDASAVMYYVPMRSGLFRFFCRRDDSYVCCSGTGIESFSKLADSVYFHDAGTLYVNLLVPAEVSWKSKDVRVRQETGFPDSPTTTLAVFTPAPVRFALKLRIPAWTTSGSTVRLNGRPYDAQIKPGSYLTLDREWNDGDRVELALPMALHLEPLPGRAERAAVMYGPIVLAGGLGTAQMDPDCINGMGGDSWRIAHEGPALDAPRLVVEPGRPLSEWITPVEGKPLTFRTAGVGRPTDVELVPFSRLFGQRYAIYWDLLSPSAWERLSESKPKLPEGVRDRVVVGDDRSEELHNYQSWHPERGVFDGRAWVRSDSWVRYDVNVSGDRAIMARFVFAPDDVKTFDLTIDGVGVATPEVAGAAGDPVALDVRLPPERTSGREKITLGVRVHREGEVRRTPRLLQIDLLDAD